MGKINYYMSESGTAFIKPLEKYEYISRNDCLEFLDYLIREGHHVEERKVRGLFSTFDLTKNDVEILDRIKSYPDAESAYEAFSGVPKNKPNPNHKLMPELENIYREDLYEYLLENGVEEAEKISDIIRNGEYKQYRRQNKMILSEKFDLWAKGCHSLPARNKFQSTFRIDYQLYKNSKEYQKLTENITSIILWCENIEGFRVNREDIIDFRITDLFEAYSAAGIVIHRSPVEIKHQIIKIKVRLGTMAESQGRQYDLYERLNSFNDITSIGIEYENGEQKEIPIKWSELSGEAHGETDFNQKHVCDIENGKLTGTFTSSFIIDYWTRGVIKNEKNEETEKESNEKPAENI